jgi:hypothetical protein
MKALPNLLALLIVFIPVAIANRYKGQNLVLFTYGSLAALAVGGIAILGADRSGLVLLSAVMSGLMCTFSVLGSLGRKRSSMAARDEAFRRGVRVEEVERELPFFHGSNKAYELKRQTCSKYSVRRTAHGTLGNWTFLMRTTKDGAQYPNGFLFRAAGGEPPPEMQAILSDVAEKASEEYLELEGSKSEVSAFWDAWGGEEQFGRVNEWLQKLSRF